MIPAITQLLEQHRALIESRDLSFDEKVGFIFARFNDPATSTNLKVYSNPTRLDMVREALREDISRRLSEASRAQLERDATRRAEQEQQREQDQRNNRRTQHRADISEEKRAIQNIIATCDLNEPITVQQLDVHVKRLARLQAQKENQI